jgi:mono/diheme cytochrome c family protein
MRKRSLTVLLLFASAIAVAQDLARGQEIGQQKCDTCHTLRDDKRQPIVGLLAGGKLIGGVASANLTPDPSGISYFDEKLFVQVLRTGQVGARKLEPVMKPALFNSLSDDDLKDVFAYLHRARGQTSRGQYRAANALPSVPPETWRSESN